MIKVQTPQTEPSQLIQNIQDRNYNSDNSRYVYIRDEPDKDNTWVVIGGSLATLVSLATLMAFGVKVTNSMSELKATLKDDIIKNREQISNVHNKFEVGLVEIEATLEGQAKDFVALQLKTQMLLRSFDRRLQYVERHIRSTNSNVLPELDINEDIEGL